MFQYQEYHGYFATTAQGLEEMASEETEKFGACRIKPAYRGFYFETDRAGLYRINYCSKLISRVLAPLLTFDCHSDRYLYRTARKIRWPELFTPDHTFAVSALVSDSAIRHSRYAALRLKDAIADTFREFLGRRPFVDSSTPDIRIVLHIHRNRASIYWDTSGAPLHKRGYRIRTVKAPMQETVAAAIIRSAEWDHITPLVDPMCGSGTILAEALMAACKIPAGYLRGHFGFENLPDFDPGTWAAVKSEADGMIRPPEKGLLSGSDLSPGAIEAAEKNLGRLPYGPLVELRSLPFENIPSIENRIIISNPPYGVRMGQGVDLENFMKRLGDFLKNRCKGSTAYLYFGNREMIKYVGLRPSWKKPLKAGGLDGRIVRYELY